MLELTIGGQVYSFNFGIGFVRELNKRVVREEKSLKGGSQEVGLAFTVGRLVDGDILALVDILNVANKGQDPRVTVQALEGYIDDPETDIDELVDKVLDFLKNSNASRKQVMRLVDEFEKAQESSE